MHSKVVSLTKIAVKFTFHISVFPMTVAGPRMLGVMKAIHFRDIL